MAAFAQKQPTAPNHDGRYAGRQHANRLAVLTKALNLTDSQVASIRNAIQAQRSSLKPIAQDVKAKRQALQAAESAANPNPTAVGNALLALRSSEANLKAGREKLQASIRSFLTPEQQKTMDALKVFAQARHARFRRFRGEPTATGSM